MKTIVNLIILYCSLLFVNCKVVTLNEISHVTSDNIIPQDMKNINKKLD